MEGAPRPDEFELTGQRPNLPLGTRVVLVERSQDLAGGWLEAGTACVIKEVHGRWVKVVTPSGLEATVADGAVVLQRVSTDPAAVLALDPRQAWEAYRGQIVLVTRVGSTAWNLTVDGSDEDRRGCYLAPFEATSALHPAPQQLLDPDQDGVYWELEKLIALGLKADPNLLETLYGPVIEATTFGERILAEREAFLSRRVLSSFGRYGLAQLELLRKRRRRNELMEELAGLWRDAPQLDAEGAQAALARRLSEREGLGQQRATKDAKGVLKDLAQSLKDRGETPDRDPQTLRAYLVERDPPQPGWLTARSDKPKNAVHLLRILHAGVSLLEGRGPLIRIEGPLRERLLKIRSGEFVLDEIVAEARDLALRMGEAVKTSPLPPEPDLARAQALLQEGRRRAHPLHAVSPTWTVRAAAPAPPLPPAAERFLAERDERWVLVGLAGSRAFGYAKPDSDVDLAGVHVAPTRELLGWRQVAPTAKALLDVDGTEIDFTSHEVGKVVGDLARGSGAMLERVLVHREAVVREHPRADELRELARAAQSRAVLPHYQGLVRSRLAAFDNTPRAKLLIHGFRAALTGLHLLRAREVEVRLPSLLELCPGYERVAELIADRDRVLDDPRDAAPWLELLKTTQAALDEAAQASPLPEQPPNAAQLEAWLVDLRVQEG
jgi:uncharacterized protein